MIRKQPKNDLVNSPGQIVNKSPMVNFEMPLTKAIDEYNQPLSQKAQEAHEKALQAAYERGYRVGYQKGLSQGLDCDSDVPPHLRHLDPSSEAGR